MRPELLAAAGIDHQLDAVPDGFAGGPDEQLVKLPIPSPERSPAKLDRFESSAHRRFEARPQRIGLVKQHRAVRFNPVSINPAKQSRNRLTAGLAHYVPQSDVDSGNRVLDGTASSLPETGLAEILADSLWLNPGRTDQHRLQQFDGSLDEGSGREAASDAGDALIGVNLDQRVKILLRLMPLRPATIDGVPGQGKDIDLCDLHGSLAQ